MPSPRGSFISTLSAVIGVFLWTTSAFAQEAAPTTGAQPPAWMQFFPFLVVFGIMYFLMIRPQAKKQKAHQEFLTKLKRGDQVITGTGILGRIEGITEQFVTLEIADGVRVKMVKAQVLGPANLEGAKT